MKLFECNIAVTILGFLEASRICHWKNMRALDVNDGIRIDGAVPPTSGWMNTDTKENFASDVGINMADYPPPLIPTAPILSFASLNFARGKRPPSILDAGEARFVTSGRVAIALALRQMKVREGDTVLVPAYHCASMIEPVIWTGATPVFYRINLDTSVNLDDIASKLNPSTKVLMVTNYFGFPQNLTKIRAFCDDRGLLMLEDCAHSFLGAHKGKSIGSYGDYAIASSMKFFPIYEGGCLASSRHSLKSVSLHTAGIGFEAKVIFNTLEDGFEYHRLGVMKALLWLPMFLKNFLWGQIKVRKSSGLQSLAPSSSDGGFGFDPNWLDKSTSCFSHLLLKLVSRRRMALLRRKNYQKLHDALTGLPGCRPLFESLPDDVFPWVFPLITDDPTRIFKTLKWAGVPIVRFGEYLWPGVDATTCSASVDLSQRVLQFPCHQELRQNELEWMITQIRGALLSQGSSKT